MCYILQVKCVPVILARFMFAKCSLMMMLVCYWSNLGIFKLLILSSDILLDTFYLQMMQVIMQHSPIQKRAIYARAMCSLTELHKVDFTFLVIVTLFYFLAYSCTF